MEPIRVLQMHNNFMPGKLPTASVNDTILYLESGNVGILASQAKGMPLTMIEDGRPVLPDDNLKDCSNGVVVPAGYSQAVQMQSVLFFLFPVSKKSLEDLQFFY
ncbi:MAG: hypothetical protein ABIX01_07970 [Chitinophagaceae bacterium]